MKLLKKTVAAHHLLRLANCQLVGRRFWLLPFLPLVWLGFQAILLLTGARAESFEAAAAQNTLIGLPMTVLAVFLGVRVIAGELDARSLEIAYTVPGGTHRLWLIKLVAAWLMVLSAGAMLAFSTFVFFTPYPLGALYGAIQASTFYLVVAMGFGALTRSEVGGAMACAALLGFNGVLTGFGENPLRASPFWNPSALTQADANELFAWTLQNRIGIALALVAVLALAFGRADRREKMLAG